MKTTHLPLVIAGKDERIRLVRVSLILVWITIGIGEQQLKVIEIMTITGRQWWH